MNTVSTENLREKSQWLREQILELVVNTNKGHIPSCYSCTEIIVSLFYGGYLNFNAENPDDRNRDRILVSKGHAAMVLYPVLADLGFFSESELGGFCTPDGLLRMYADNSIPGIESITGSLGHGLGIGAGYALSAKRDDKSFKSFVVLGDGECYEGSIWETALFASSSKLDNLVAIVDRNRLCIMDETENCVELGDISDKFRAFGWDAYNVDGHSYQSILPVMNEVTTSNNGKPKVIVSNSVKGKGISFMENQPLWHNKMMNDDQVADARRQLAINCIVD